jgi:Family of unknown function (DUF6011)
MNQIANEPRKPGGYLFEDQGELPTAGTTTTDADIRKNTSIVNGGEATAHPCPKCGGSGQTRWGPCFKCKGAGKVSRGVIAAAKGKVTKLANQQAWKEEHRAELAYMAKRIEKGSNYYYGFQVRLDAHGTLNDGVIEIIRKDMAKDAEFYAAKKAEREAAAPTVEISAIEKLFAGAIENDVKKPIYRAESIELSRAPASGRNAGSIYVKRNGEYAGKITDGKYHATYGAPADTIDRLMAVAADPLKESMAYGRKFGNCGLCGRDLVDPVSIRSGVGPICSRKWNLDHLRDEARQTLEENEEQEKLR